MDTNPLMGCLIEVGFEGGHGAASIIGESFNRLGFQDGLDLGLAMATVGLLLSSMLFMSLPYISNTEKHVKITLISNLLQIKSKIWLTIIAYLINLIFSAWMLIETIEWMDFAIKLNLKTENSRLLLSPWMAVVPLSFSVNIIISIKKIFKLIIE